MDHPDFRKMEEKNLSLTLGVDICINHFVVSYSSMYYSIMLLPVCDCGWTPIGNQLYSMILSVKPCAAMEFQGASFSYHVIGTLLGRLHPFHTENNENTGNMSFGGVFSHLILNIWTIWILICILYIYMYTYYHPGESKEYATKQSPIQSSRMDFPSPQSTNQVAI